MINNEACAQFPGSFGIAWYRREQWALLKSVATDSDEIEETYDEWLEFAQRYLKEVWESGIDILKVEIDVEELIQWCQTNNRAVDGEARSDFVVLKLKERDQD
jgi:hypothetical protein